MSQPSDGIIAEVIREIMPPYRLGADLLRATFAALPAPPPEVSAAWREARIARPLQEIPSCKPAAPGQPRAARHNAPPSQRPPSAGATLSGHRPW